MCFFFFLKIIDSIMALFRVDFCGRGELADRQQKLAQMLSKLQKISEGNKNKNLFFSRKVFIKSLNAFFCNTIQKN